MIVTIALFLSGCSTTMIFTKGMSASDKDDGTSMVFGHIDSNETNTSLYEFSIMKKENRNGVDRFEHYDTRTADNGMFYLENLESGEYLLGWMYAKTYPVFGEPYTFRLPDATDGKEFAMATVKITKPGIYYMGSYKIYVMKNPSFSHGEVYNVRKEVSPSEKDLLKQMSAHLRGSGWDKDAAARMRLVRK